MEKLYGLIGWPVSHSMSPAIHNHAFSELNISGHYHAFPVSPQGLEKAVAGLRALGISGFNVTIPHKVAILPYLDELDLSAELAGAVNTVKNSGGRLIGYNTDGQGYLQSLKEKAGELQGKNILLIGAGGAARAIFYTLSHAGCRSIDVCNRTIEKAAELIQLNPAGTFGRPLAIQEAEDILSKYDVIIQTTSIGMKPHAGKSPIRLYNAKKTCIVSDIIYNPITTELLKQAEEKGLKTVNGVGMFVNQAALSFEIWTDRIPDKKGMERIVLDNLGGTTC
ncbi:shikimate dehydrogenase [Bacillus lacus]|uniref:Shikimate dehydrogenase (NADP(+)) n=1 Tax=Metabacillus lacus TaxID=1983721 RepID=A0A7X2IX06_9BACI|nr:shikimate dehydrogenase [Metabacillus lacus]